MLPEQCQRWNLQPRYISLESNLRLFNPWAKALTTEQPARALGYILEQFGSVADVGVFLICFHCLVVNNSNSNKFLYATSL